MRRHLRPNLLQALLVALQTLIPFGCRGLGHSVIGRANSSHQFRGEIFHGFFRAFLRGLSVHPALSAPHLVGYTESAHERRFAVSSHQKKRPVSSATRNGLLPDEEPDIRKEIADLVPDPKKWLNTPNSRLGGSR